MLLFSVEVIYLWRALPFCSVEVKRQLLGRLSAPLPEAAQPVHRAMRAWLRGGLFSSLNDPVEADKASNSGWRSLALLPLPVLLMKDLPHEYFRVCEKRCGMMGT